MSDMKLSKFPEPIDWSDPESIALHMILGDTMCERCHKDLDFDALYFGLFVDDGQHGHGVCPKCLNESIQIAFAHYKSITIEKWGQGLK